MTMGRTSDRRQSEFLTDDSEKAGEPELVEALGRPEGGFIAKWYPSPDAVEHSEERIAAMCESFVAAGGSG